MIFLGKINIALFVVGNKKIFLKKKLINPNKFKKTITKTKLKKNSKLYFLFNSLIVFLINTIWNFFFKKNTK